ncbi:glycine-rich RNA-binding protein 2, mitochondrial-like [Actinidia eriantha]|uniref:glycine-rich RNA-binding protein 2, mitochondrial-like n=1 Tax=Actinidia eriantha TaxID=165200 RepID=UPI0025825BD5|nr:glycine-rich RNA-binding protein 2, mitochondrial-like [Actinidia eriantha]
MTNSLGSKGEDLPTHSDIFASLSSMAEVEFKCFVGGLAWAIDDWSLENAFAQFGVVIESKIINDREIDKSRGFGFVTFKDEKLTWTHLWSPALSKSYIDGRMQIQSYQCHRPPSSNPYNLPQTHMGGVKDLKFKKGKSTNGPSWGFTDPEFERKKRVASYKAYSVEGKFKGSFRKSFKWIKDRYNQVVYGWG